MKNNWIQFTPKRQIKVASRRSSFSHQNDQNVDSKLLFDTSLMIHAELLHLDILPLRYLIQCIPEIGPVFSELFTPFYLRLC